MAKDNNNSFNHNIPIIKEPDSNKSFVKKVRSHVSGLLPSSLSKWFGNTDNDSKYNKVRQREEDDDDDDDCYEIQPPSKRARKPSPPTSPNNLHVNLQPPPEFNVNVIVNHQDSDSSDSTSGYSSTPRFSKNVADIEKPKTSTQTSNASFEKLHSPFGSHNRSLFTERSISPQMNSSLSSRRPAFNASTFGSPNFVDRTLSTKRIINSPFYSGRTTFGGASAYNKLSRPIRPSSLENKVQVKNINQNDNATLSKTARRILDTLEQYSTPITDAKKIPNLSLKRTQMDGLLSKYTGANPYLIREKVTAPNKELLVPTVPDLLKMKLKERLQDSTVAVRQIATTSKSTLNSDEYKIRTLDDPVTKHTNKIKNKLTSTRQKQDLQPVEEVKLPEVSLPITTLPKFDFSLPLPPSCSKPLVTVACNDPPKTAVVITPPEPVVSKTLPEIKDSTTSTPNAVEYKFASPLVLAENLISIIAINDFKFSEPVVKQKNKSVVDTKLSPMMVPNNFKASDMSTITLKRKKNVEPPPVQLLTGSSVEEAFSKSELLWKCSSCSTENKSDVYYCVNCNISKSSIKRKMSTENSIVRGFGDTFKPKEGEWECNSCMVRNPSDKVKCVACESPKQGATKTATTTLSEPSAIANDNMNEVFKRKKVGEWLCNTCMIHNPLSQTKCAACATPKASIATSNAVTVPSTTVPDFGLAFKRKTDEWECNACMVRNSNDVKKCVACETPKSGSTVPTVNLTAPVTGTATTTAAPVLSFNSAAPAGSFGDAFKKKEGEWECSACMVRNSSDKVKCLSCETPKSLGTVSSASVTSTVTTPNFGQAFKRKNDEWECGACMVRNSNDVKKCVACETPKPGAQLKGTTEKQDGSSSSFKFGIFNSPKPTNIGENKEKETSKLTFNASSTAAASASPSVPTFTFGIPAKTTLTTTPQVPSKSSEVMFKTPEKPTGFVFNTNSPSTPKPATSLAVSKPDEKSKQPTFNFGNSHSQPDGMKASMLGQKSTGPLSQEQKPAGFSFGTSTPQTSSANGIEVKNAQHSGSSIIFSPPKQQPSVMANKNQLNKPAQSDNIFGNLTKTTTPAQNMPSSSFAFNAPPSTSAALFTFGAKTTTMSTLSNTATTTTTEAPGFKFNSPRSQQQSPPRQNADGFKKPTSTANIFGNNTSAASIFGAAAKAPFEAPKSAFETTSKPAFEAPAFGTGFGATSAAAPSNFGSTPAAASSNFIPTPAASSTGFGATPTASSGGFAATPAASSGGFGSTPAVSSGGFGVTPAASVFGASTTSSSIFGPSGGTSGFGLSVTTTAPAFGSAITTTTSGFGSSIPSVSSGFGSGGFGASTSEKPFAFGGRATEEQPKAPVFSFGQDKPAEPAKPSGVFNFSGSLQQNPPAGGFSFNPAPNVTPNFSFNAGKIENPSPFQSTGPQSNVFNVGTQPVQQQSQPIQNGGFNFGNTGVNNNVKAGFNFGGSGVPQFHAPGAPAAVPTPGAFSFGGPNANPAPAAGGFNFGANSATPNFNANMKPTFNFTGGATPTFSAQLAPEGSPAVAQRRRLKATRRTQPR